MYFAGSSVDAAARLRARYADGVTARRDENAMCPGVADRPRLDDSRIGRDPGVVGTVKVIPGRSAGRSTACGRFVPRFRSVNETIRAAAAVS